jgi:hypothetical protein
MTDYAELKSESLSSSRLHELCSSLLVDMKVNKALVPSVDLIVSIVSRGVSGGAARSLAR